MPSSAPPIPSVAMPVYQLIDQLVFPPPELAEPGGLLAVGGDLSPERLLLAYSMGIFPWYNPGEPILWWSPDPRCILEPETLRISRSLAKVLRRQTFEVTFDRDFSAVIDACAESRRSREGTWITPEMQRAYCRLHELGFAHSVECRQDGVLVGGLYGVSLGRCFFGESMFHQVADASKVALVHLLGEREDRHFTMVDCQLSTPHLVSLGAQEIARADYLGRLKAAGVSPSLRPLPPPFP